MSRVIPHSNVQWTGIPVEYLGTVGSYGGTGSGGFNSSTYPTSNSLTNSSSTSYSQFTPASGGEGSSRWGFGISGIPSNAVINSVTCMIKVACSNSTGFSTARAQFFCGDTSKGTALDFTNNSSTTARSYTNCGTWTTEELSSLELRITAKKSGSSNRYINFYGADLTITYSYDETEYEITASSDSSTITVSPSSQYITEGGTGVVIFNNISDISEVGVDDNNVNVTNELVNSSRTTYTYTISDIDSDHVITVKDVPSVYVTIVNNSSKVNNIEPISGSVLKVGQDSNVDVKIWTDEIDHINIFDDDVKNNNVIFEEEIIEDNTTCIPSSYSDGDFSTMASMSSGYNSTTNTSVRANIQASTSTEQQVYFNFNVSSIPENATIISVTCSARICVSNNYTTGSIQLYSGTTSKSSANSSWRTIKASNVYTLSGIQSFTRSELSNARLKISGKSGGSGRSIYFYGADLNVVYEYAGDTYYLYTSNATKTKTVRIETRPTYQVTASSSVSGATISPSSWSVYEDHDIVFNMTIPDIDVVSVTDNGNNIKNLLVGSGTSYTYTITNINTAHTISISEIESDIKMYQKINGQYINIKKVYKKISNIWREVQIEDLTEKTIYINKDSTN